MTKLTVPILVQSLEQALAAGAQARVQGADLIEWRLDSFADAGRPERLAQLQALVERAPLPCIVTCRPGWEGGQYEGEERERISLLEHAGLAGPAYLDVELAAYQASAGIRQKVNLVVDQPGGIRGVAPGGLRGRGTQLILSSHDFTGRPADLAARVEAMENAAACRVSKIVWQAREVGESVEALRLLASRKKPMIALCMGEAGLLSRVLAKKFDAVLTFAALATDQGTAAGQPTVAELRGLYRWEALQADTRVYGVIGHPVAHSMSPAIHNAGFDATGFNGIYLPLPVAPGYEALARNLAALLAWERLDFGGASVTLPHKENLLRFVREAGSIGRRGEVEPLAQAIGAANTLTVRADGSLYASNTDYAAALDAVCASLEIGREDLAGQRIAVLGAGGAARAIVAGLAHYGATVVVYNRTPGRAQQLAAEFNGRTGQVVPAPLDKLGQSCCSVYINCTPVGMHPNVDDTPVSDGARPEGWGPGAVVFDTIYNPYETRLLKEARAAGCLTIPGAEMFVRQAVGQFEGWTGAQAPREVFRKVVIGRLGYKNL